MALRWLNIGCGHDYKEGWVNLDKFNGKVDIVADLEDGLPFEDETIDYVYASHVFEHVIDVVGLIVDIHRVLKPKGILEVYVPYGTTTSIHHVRYFFLKTMNPFMKFDKPTSFEPSGLFRNTQGEITRYAIPFAWHLNHYLKIWLFHLPLWKRSEIHWVLEKIGHKR